MKGQEESATDMLRSPVLPTAIPSDAAALRIGRRALVGTWRAHVESPDFPPFDAFHTFHDDGTFTEVSSLLATLTESPAHGVWASTRDGFLLTFELFGFDETGAPNAIIRVRNWIQIPHDRDHFEAQSVVDILDLDGTVVAPEVGSASVQATRIGVAGP
jgi:hypothetical protein